jgi:hypothetical protein
MPVSCQTVTVISVPVGLEATDIVITTSACIEPCGIGVTVTWHNGTGGDITGQVLGITVNGITPTGGTVTADIPLDGDVTYTFTVTGLTSTGSPYDICPAPN